MGRGTSNKTNRVIWPVFYEEARICATERSKGQTQGREGLLLTHFDSKKSMGLVFDLY